MYIINLQLVDYKSKYHGTLVLSKQLQPARAAGLLAIGSLRAACIWEPVHYNALTHFGK